MEEERQNTGRTEADNLVDVTKTPSPTEMHETPAIAKLIDVDTDVNAITSEPLTPTNKPLHIDLTEKLRVSSPVPTPQLQPTAGSPDQTSGSASLRELLPTIDERETLQLAKKSATDQEAGQRTNLCDSLQSELERVKAEKDLLAQEVSDMKSRLLLNKEELEREVQKRVELEQRFTEEAKRTSDQIEELIAKSESDDNKINELKSRFELYSRETSSMIESFTTNRELLASQLLEMRKENDLLLGQYLSKARDLQSASIDLPQTVEDLQFHCLTLNEKLILSTMAKERLEEAMILSSPAATNTTNVPHAPTTST